MVATDLEPAPGAGSKFVEGYLLAAANPMVFSEASDSFDEEEDQDSHKLARFRRSLRMSIADFYNNLGDLTSSKRQQPGFAKPFTIWKAQSLAEGDRGGRAEAEIAAGGNGSKPSLGGQTGTCSDNFLGF